MAWELAKRIGATVVAGDAVSIELRKRRTSYERTRAIVEKVAVEIVRRGGNVILDSDFIDAEKRASLREKARKAGVRVAFVRVYCDLDVMSQRIRENDPGEFFNRASTKSTVRDHGKDVKFREVMCRLRQHYRRENENGGRLVIKNPPCAVIADIDTTDTASWKREVAKCAKWLLS